MSDDARVQGVDKMPLADYVDAILTGVTEGIIRYEERIGTNSGWVGSSGDVEPEVVLKPVRVVRGTKTTREVWVDLDEPDKWPRTRLKLRVTRLPGDKDDWEG